MNINTKSLKPIFIQVKEWLENEILEERIRPTEQVLSQNELAKLFNINPMTALKGITILESNGILEKRRGVGMFVKANAKEIIHKSRMRETLNEILDDLVSETLVLKLSTEEVLSMVAERLNNIQEEV